jgi:hypothetical protein
LSGRVAGATDPADAGERVGPGAGDDAGTDFEQHAISVDATMKAQAPE